MPAKKKVAKRKAGSKAPVQRKKPATRKSKKTGDPLRDTWVTAMDALHSAQEEAEKQLRGTLKRNKISAKEATDVIKNVRKRFEKQRRKAVKEFDAGVSSFQLRMTKERKALTKMANDAVRHALASLNIPSRREVAELTRKVEQLSKKIDAFKR
jgi:polyhydroxyalkanoate synthesis regulator phasin